MKGHGHASDVHAQPAQQTHYARLGLMTVLSFTAMCLLMYAMVDRLENVVMNLNQVCMAALMTSPMELIELLLMRGMYSNGNRQQTTIGNRHFLRSMIPHHAGAILMCQQASITSADIRRLCQGIVSSQQAEIDQMTAMLRAAR